MSRLYKGTIAFVLLCSALLVLSFCYPRIGLYLAPGTFLGWAQGVFCLVKFRGDK